jgi:dCMP deaminase
MNGMIKAALSAFEQENGQRKWDGRFLQMAELVSSWSKDPSTKVGAVIVDENQRVVSLGFNGFPRAVADDSRLEDRALKNMITIHAEKNAILFARRDLTDCTIYVHRSLPCAQCASFIMQSGITTVVVRAFGHESPESEALWRSNHEVAQAIMSVAGIRIRITEGA